jgi:ferritin-like protein
LNIRVAINAIFPLESSVAPKKIKTWLCIHHNELTQEDKPMPSEITDVEKFVALSAKSKQCQVKRLKDTVKLKLRTPGQLYTLKIEPLRADEIIKRLQCTIVEEEK